MGFTDKILKLLLEEAGQGQLTRRARLLNKFPGAIILPFIGNAGILFGNSREIQNKFTLYMKKHGKTVRAWLISKPVIWTIEPSIIQKVLSSPNFIEKGDAYFSIKRFLGNGLITSIGNQWKVDRKMLNPMFNYNQFHRFVQTFNASATTLMEILNENLQTDSQPQPFQSIFAGMTLEVVINSSLKCNMAVQRLPDELFVQAMHTIANGVTQLLFKPWLGLPLIRTLFGNHLTEQKSLKFSSNKLMKIVEERRRLRNLKKSKRIKDLNKPGIDILLESEISKNEKDLSDHVLTIIGAGSGSVSRGLNFTLFFLAVNPECQERVRQEIEQVFEKDGAVTLSDISKLKYLEMCIKESLRIFPPVPFISRKSQNDFKLDDGRIIPQDCEIFIDIFDLHHDPDLYPNPEAFDPERFKNEECNKRNHFGYLAFSAGPRNCIGWKFATKELVVALVYILRKYKVGTKQKYQDLQFVPAMPADTHPRIQLSFSLL